MRNDEEILVESQTPAARKRVKAIKRAKAQAAKRKVTQWTKARERDLIKALKGRKATGLSVEKIAKQFGVSPGAIRQKSHSMGISAHGKAA